MTADVPKPLARLVCRPIEVTDVDAVVDVHMHGFRGFFLTFLGSPFLHLLYSSLVGAPEGVGIVATLDGQVIAVAAGVTEQGTFYRRLIRERKWRFAAASVRALVRHPTIAPRLLRALRRPADVRMAAAAACLMSLVVVPEHAHRGVGSLIARHFFRALAQRGAPSVCLTTDRCRNETVCAWYQRLGFQLDHFFRTPEGRWMNEYVLDLRGWGEFPERSTDITRA